MTRTQLANLKNRTFAKCSIQDMRLGYGSVPAGQLMSLIEAMEARIAKLEKIQNLQAVIHGKSPKRLITAAKKELAKELIDE